MGLKLRREARPEVIPLEGKVKATREKLESQILRLTPQMGLDTLPIPAKLALSSPQLITSQVLYWGHSKQLDNKAVLTISSYLLPFKSQDCS